MISEILDILAAITNKKIKSLRTANIFKIHNDTNLFISPFYAFSKLLI